MKDTIECGDTVTYHGSLTEYHPYEFRVLKLWKERGIECALLQGPHLDIWIKRCRVSNLVLVEKESQN